MFRKRLTLLSWSSASRSVESTKAGAEADDTDSPEKLSALRQVYLASHFTAISSKASKTKEQLEREQILREEKARKNSHYKTLYESLAKTTQNGDSRTADLSRRLSQPRSAGLPASHTKRRREIRRRTSRLLNNPGLACREYAEFVDIPTDREHIHVDDQAVFFETEDEIDFNEAADNAATTTTTSALPSAAEYGSRIVAASPPPAAPPTQPLHVTCHFCRTAHAVSDPASAENGPDAEGDGSGDATLLSGHDTAQLRSVYERGRHRARARRQRLADKFAEPTRDLCATIHGRLSSLSLGLPSAEATG